MSVTRNVGKAMSWTIVARVSRFVLGLVSSVIVVRGLGDANYGVFSLLRTIMMVIVIGSSFGFGQAMLKFLPPLRTKGDRHAMSLVVRWGLLVPAATWMVLLGLSWFFGDEFAALFGGLRGNGSLIVAAVAFAGMELAFGTLATLLNSAYDTRRLSIGYVLSHVVYIVGLFIVIPRGWGVMGVLGAAAVGYFAATMILIDRAVAAVPQHNISAVDAPNSRRLIRYALPFAAIHLLNLVVWRESETFILGAFRSMEEVGYFNIAYRIPQMILEFVPGTVWPLVMAGFSDVYARDPGQLQPAIDRYYRMLFLICAPLCVMGAVFGGAVIDLLYGPEMAAAQQPTRWFFLIFTMSFLGTPLSMALYVMEKTITSLLVYLALAGVNVGLDLLLIPRYGVSGAIVAVAIVIGFSPMLYRYVVGRSTEVKIPLGFVARCFLGSSGVLLLLPVLRFLDHPVWLGISGVVAAVMVLVGYKMFKVVGDKEADMLSAVTLPLAGRLVRLVRS